MYPERRSEAFEDFYDARRKAQVSEVIKRIRGTKNYLLSFDEIRQKLGAVSIGRKTLRNIPLESIVGSVNRYEDFTREFLPRASIDPDRWVGVKRAVSNMEGLEPIDVYQINEVYFVHDGNHRVSVARQMGSKTIQANVTEFKTRVPLTPNDRPEDIIIKAEYASFLEQTRLDQLRPGIDLNVSVPGAYQTLHEHISLHRSFASREQNRSLS